jgi:hypothetical protein
VETFIWESFNLQWSKHTFKDQTTKGKAISMVVFNKIKDLWDFESNYWNFFKSMHVHHTPLTLLPRHFEKIKGFTTRLELNF